MELWEKRPLSEAIAKQRRMEKSSFEGCAPVQKFVRVRKCALMGTCVGTERNPNKQAA